MWRALPLVLLLGCGNKNNTPTQAEDAAEAADGAEDATDGGGEDAGADETDGGGEDAGDATDGGEDPEGDAGADTPPTPASLYAQCQDRLEQPQAEGECTTDADCTTGGCGGEVCSTPAGLADWMSTCEVKPCFKAVEACGCREGMCTWSLKDKLPEMKKPGNKLPPTRLPATPPPKPSEGGE